MTNISGGHTHIDNYESNAYEVRKPGIGQKIKNAFRKAGHKNREEEDYEGVTYGPNGEKIVEKHHYEERL